MSQSLSAEQLTTTVQVVIPARLASSRLPRKMLLRETGKTLIQHTYEAASRAMRPAGVCVATDSDEIAAEITAFGGKCVMTDPRLASGTDRVAAVARSHGDWGIVVNVQGDEPEIAGTAIDLVVRRLEERSDAVMSTLATPIRSRRQLEDPACVKVVFDSLGRALYFSRAAIPMARQCERTRGRDELTTADPALFYQHVGIYAYRRDFLLELAQMSPSRLEQLEGLEQLRVLEAGYTIVVDTVDECTFGIDTRADYQAFVERVQSR